MKRHVLLAAALLPALPASLALAQSEEATKLSAVTVFAGLYPTGELPGAILNSLEVVRTPGAAADINRALQTFPGVQIPDEGNALFVRGGDSIETATLVNGLRYPTATRLNAPAGNFAGTLNPFEARRITFASGGFGARFGNALSGVVDLDTLGSPGAHSLTIGGGIGALSLGVAGALNDHAGLRLHRPRLVGQVGDAAGVGPRRRAGARPEPAGRDRCGGRRGVPRPGPGDADHGGDQRHEPGHQPAPAVTGRP